MPPPTTARRPRTSASVLPAPAPVPASGGSEILPHDRLQWVEAWGMADRVMGYVHRPSTVEGIRRVFEIARRTRKTIALRGAGRSYGDAALEAEQIILDLTRFNRILDWNPDTGIIRVESGATIQQIWEYAIEDGWWPAVVPGTMYPTVGGAAGMNIHGKNNFRVGTFGDNIIEFAILLPTGEVRRCSRERNADLFHAAIGGFGMLGVFLDITLKMKRIHSGVLDVRSLCVPNLREMTRQLEREESRWDYMVGWVDCFPTGRDLGRGILHYARQLKPGEDPAPANSLRMENQALPENLFGVIPKSIMWRFTKPLVNRWGMWAVNTAKYHLTRLGVAEKPQFYQSHAAFQFLLDYIPNWKFSYLPGGLIQYQSFLPKDAAAEVFERQIRLMHRRGIVSYLGVFKRHRPDPFLMTHGLDGFSLALDFPVTASNRSALWRMADEFNRMTIEAGGRLYFAKDSTMKPGTVFRYMPPASVAKFLALKAECDPEGILSTALWRRVFGSTHAAQALVRERAAM